MSDHDEAQRCATCGVWHYDGDGHDCMSIMAVRETTAISDAVIELRELRAALTAAAERETAAQRRAEYWKAEHNAANDVIAAERQKVQALREFLRLRTISWRTDERHKGEVAMAGQTLDWMDALGLGVEGSDGREK